MNQIYLQIVLIKDIFNSLKISSNDFKIYLQMNYPYVIFDDIFKWFEDIFNSIKDIFNSFEDICK